MNSIDDIDLKTKEESETDLGGEPPLRESQCLCQYSLR
jgi:hypothetical protein